MNKGTEQNQIQIKSLPLNDVNLEIKKEGDFTGYASVFNKVDSYSDTIMPGAYDNVLKSGDSPIMFFNHLHNEIPIGIWTKLEQDDYGLKVSGKLLKGMSKADDIAIALKNKALDGLSIGYSLAPDDYEFKDGVRIIHNISKLSEISIVTFPADSFARINSKSVEEDTSHFTTIKDYEKYLRDVGFSNNGAKVFISSFKSLIKSEFLEDELKKEEDLKQILESFKLVK